MTMDAVRSSSDQCPVCKSEQTHFALKARDHSVSGEWFEIWECNHCSLRFTRNAPDQESSVRYYQSENYISHSNTRKGLVNTLYHRVRNHTLQYKIQTDSFSYRIKTGDTPGSWRRHRRICPVYESDGLAEPGN